ncbi:nucleotidyltransferase domain-containing protein [Clostridium mobile]|uniref:nucleotidyltransferase domain-containing protein n=1 Tax=Clostridium mobile TaxID=2841512 RepID=UPI001FE6DF98|nr:nucleotidyltransferase domain-containing protein [Clostridium mobile]
MMPFKEEIDNIKNQIINRYKPYKIILFGSCATGCAKEDSDIDLCIILNYEDKQEALMDLLMNIEYDRDVDFILYRPGEWEKYKEDTTTFASLINRKGVTIYG